MSIIQYLPDNSGFLPFKESMNLVDGIYNGLYNKEPAIIRIEKGTPVYVTFIGFLNAEGESCPSSIFDPKGIMHSSVELLVKANVKNMQSTAN